MSTESGMVLEALLSANEMCRSAAEIARRGGADTNWPLFLKRLTESCVLQARVIHGHEVREDSATCTPKTFKNPRYELAAAPTSPPTPAMDDIAKEQTARDALRSIANLRVECPVCGPKILEQLLASEALIK